MNRLERFKHYFKAISSVLLGRVPAGRGLTVFRDDVFIVSYFRSGSTWARFLFGNFIHQDKTVTFANMNRLVPIIYDNSDRVLRSLPRVLKSHECFDPRYPKAIYIVRDPRDVAVSFYYFNVKVGVIPDQYPMDEFVIRFIAAKVVGYADRVGCWEDHVLSWLRMRQGKSGFQLLRYEDLLADPGKELARVAPLLGVESTLDRIERAVNLSSATRMRSLERTRSWPAMKNTRQDIPFVRDAKAGGWRDKLSSASVRRIEQAWGTTMQELGYELTTKPDTSARERSNNLYATD